MYTKSLHKGIRGDSNHMLSLSQDMNHTCHMNDICHMNVQTLKACGK